MKTHLTNKIDIKKAILPPADLETNVTIISKDELERLQIAALRNDVSVSIVLIAAFAALVYRYQNEEQFTVRLRITQSYDSDASSVLEFTVKESFNSIELVNKMKLLLNSSPGWKDCIAPSRVLKPFTCENINDDEGSVHISGLFEISVDGSIIINPLSAEENIVGWVEHFTTLIDSMYSQPDTPTAFLPVISGSEMRKLLQWSVSIVDPQISKPDCLNQIFETTVDMYACKPALRCKGKEISYEDFNKKSNALARLLRLKGAKRGSHVAILLPRGEEVFIAIMGILKAGAAYVPIDPRSPAERIRYIIEDAHAQLVITDNQLSNQNNITVESICVEELDEQLKPFGTGNLSQRETQLGPDDPAYIIYTSGTTGKPKGVVLMHKTVCNLIRAESALFEVTHSDRVYQGFSVSFDASVEEMWLAWYSGAELVAATKSEALSGPDLVKFLQAEDITVFSTVPTQISMMQTPAKSVRILILGGEECRLQAIEPWLDEKRKIYNTYGPTEATVIATCGECKRGIKPSIGKPAPNYGVYILDRNLQPMPAGMFGELCIGGHCLAREYLNRADLTEKKFVSPPFTVGNQFPQRVYRSGDRARFAPDGSIEFGGRIDDQVKLRGQRIELGEIEAALLKTSGARQAAVALNTNSQGIQSLAGYLVPEDGNTIDQKKLRKDLNGFLPSYMVPGRFCTLSELPVLPSGKVDRKRLASMQVEKPGEDREVIAPRNETERIIHEVWEKFFDRKDISVTDNFFEIGGHSLLAANIVSELRDRPDMQEMPLQHIYMYRTIEALARQVKSEYTKNVGTDKHTSGEEQTDGNIKPLRSRVCALFQAAGLYLIYMLFSTPLLIPFIIDWFNPKIGIVAWATASFISMLALLPVVIVMSIAAKWLLIGKFKAGIYPLWSSYYLRFWFVSRLMDLVPTRIMRGTPFLNLYYRSMGATIGKNVYLGSDRFKACDLVSIGDNSSVNADVHLTAYKVSKGNLYLAPITVGKDCTIGTRSVLDENTAMEDFSELGELSYLPAGTIVGEGEYWEGSPASKTMQSRNTDTKRKDASEKRKITFSYITAFAAAFLAVVMIPSILLLPWVIAVFYLYVYVSLWYTVASTIFMAALYTVSFCLTVAGLKKLLLPSDNRDHYDIYTMGYIKKWFVDTMVQLSLFTVQPIYATVYLPIWLRMLGARIGRRAEISTVDHISADLLTLGDGSFIADSASVGPAVVRKGKMYVARTQVGSRSFIGNSALIPIGTRIGNNCLIGVLSKPPHDCSRKITNDTNWLGSPPIILPNRQEGEKFKLKLTFDPPRYMIALRGIVEFFKITMPAALTSCCYIFAYWFVSEILGPVATLRSYILLSPLIIFGGSIAVSILTIVLKWLLIGKYRRVQKPLWSVFLWKNEFINSLTENMVYPLLLQMLQGTPFLPTFFRLMGSKIGKNVYMETTEITEFDLVRIGDNASLNYGCTIQTHLFEDRVMKMSQLNIGENTTVGSMSVVLYDTCMKKGAVLDGLSLLMKGETLPAFTAWHGIPARSRST